MVENSHKYTDICREKLKTIEENKFKQAKATHDYKMLEQYMKGEMQKVTVVICRERTPS